VRVGDLELLPLNDGVIQLPPEFYVGLDWSRHQDLLNADGKIEMPIGCFVLRSGSRVVLVDAGMGSRSVSWGRGGALPAELARVGVALDEIDTVVCTHLHIDHIGWLVVDGAPFFPRATVRCGGADLAHFADDADAGPMLSVLSAAGRIEPISGDRVSLAPGLDALATPGHTPGHYGLVVSSGTDRAVLLGDAVECPLQLDEPDFYALSDVDPALSARTREALWRELEGTDTLVGAAHFPGLEFGRVLRGSGTRWFPLT
jgi:glyoxylase-like metal-dependent hydrolase (beta-lactamase superfamily II)